MRVLIGGDVIPTSVNTDLFIKGDIESLIGSGLKKIWEDADFRIINLETAITDTANPILKWGPNLKAPEESFKGIAALHPNLVGIANNHILDYGSEGFESTLKLLEENDIPYVGGGANLERAAKPCIIKAGNVLLGVYACAEHEFTIAENESPGANPFDPLFSLDHIMELKSKCDYLIVLYHGGKEYYRYPSPRLRQVCRKMAQKGADLILCQHSHCIGSMEKHEGATIVYGQGNFLFAKDYIDEYLFSGLLVSLDFNEDYKPEVGFIPVRRYEKGTRLAEGREKEDILDGFYTRSGEITREGFAEQKYSEFAREKHIMYLTKISGRSAVINRLDGFFLNNRLIKRRYSKKKQCMIRNYMQCEAHRELVIEGIKGEDL